MKQYIMGIMCALPLLAQAEVCLNASCRTVIKKAQHHEKSAQKLSCSKKVERDFDTQLIERKCVYRGTDFQTAYATFKQQYGELQQRQHFPKTLPKSAYKKDILLNNNEIFSTSVRWNTPNQVSVLWGHQADDVFLGGGNWSLTRKDKNIHIVVTLTAG